MKNNFFKTLFLFLTASLLFLIAKEVLPKDKLFPSSTVENIHIVKDSLMLQAIKQDSISKKDTLLIKKDSLIVEKDTVTKPEKMQYKSKFTDFENNFQLETFYKKLQLLEVDSTQHVQIAYYGDSMNDGDLIVQDLRKLFQDKYGGSGVGFVNIYSKSARTRGSVIHNFSNNWKYNSFLKRINKIALGVSGYTAFVDSTSNESWVSYIASSSPSKSKLYNPTLFYGKADGDSAKVFIDNKGELTEYKLKGKRLLNTKRLSKYSVNHLKLIFKSYKTPLYGVNFATKHGIHIDNFSTRGNSGLGMTLLHQNLMHQFQKKMNYDLVVLQFGTNVVSVKSKSFSWYKKGMERAVNHLKNAFEGADVLVFSVADKSRKYDTAMKTDSTIYALIKSQYYIAKETNSGFLNLYKLMGGENSMAEWVEGTPRYANKDYTHFNARGSRRIAKLIFKKMEAGYQKYKKTHPLEQKPEATPKPKKKKDSL